MARLSKRVRALRQAVNRTRLYPVVDALDLVKKTATAKFDESVDVAVNLGVDARKSDQIVRGSVVLPRGTGKTVRVAVFAQGDRARDAEAAGADIVGFEDLAERIKGGFLEFDVVIASPDAMRVVGPLGQILGPRGLMPNPKVGTVTPDVAGGVRNAKAGQVQFRVDKAGIVHTVVGLQVHMRGEIARYFLPDAGRALSKSTLAFLTANYTGLAATLLLALAGYHSSIEPLPLRVPPTCGNPEIVTAVLAALQAVLLSGLLVCALIAAIGLFLELGSPLMLLNRTTAALFGCALVVFHLSLDYAMRLTFIYNQWLLIVFMINAPYWIVTGAKKIGPRREAGQRVGEVLVLAAPKAVARHHDAAAKSVRRSGCR